MVTVTMVATHSMLVNMDIPEMHIIAKIATAYSIPKEAAVTAIINRGMDSIARQVTEVMGKATKKLNEDDNG